MLNTDTPLSKSVYGVRRSLLLGVYGVMQVNRIADAVTSVEILRTFTRVVNRGF